jgi:peptide/nickel transport system substrate-binding protein
MSPSTGAPLSIAAPKRHPDKGGRNLFGAYFYDVDCADPTCKLLRAHGDKAFFGWPNIPALEAEIVSWYDACNFEEEKAAARLINKVALENVVYAPLGQFLQYQTWRKNVSGVQPGPLLFFWGVTKTA